MLLYLLIAQRNNSYPGEHALENLAAMSEYDREDNEEYIAETEAEIRSSSEFERLAWITAEIDEEAVIQQMNKEGSLAWADTPTPEGDYVVRVLFGLPNSDYPGQHGVWAVDAMDEYAISDNPGYLQEKAKEALDSQQFTSLAYVDISIDEKALRAILYPENKTLTATIV